MSELKNIKAVTMKLCELETGKSEVNIAQMSEIVRCLAILCYNQPEVLAWIIKLGKRHVDKMSYIPKY